jgi:hypothetical protein
MFRKAMRECNLANHCRDEKNKWLPLMDLSHYVEEKRLENG